MPLDYGKSQKAFKHNVSQLVKDGKPIKQALAISYSIMRGETSKPKEEKSRCWSGYEPTPNVPAYAPGSCRKKEA